MIQLLFSTNEQIGSRVIRAATFSRWSHVDMVTARGTLIGALALGGTPDEPLWQRLKQGAVIEHSLAAQINASTTYAIRHLNGDSAKAEAWVRSQLGTPYDWRGIFGCEFGRNWQDDDAWFCSELAAKAALVAGNTDLDIDVFRFTPGRLFDYTF